MNILHYNVLHGCERDAFRLTNVLSWLRERSADIVTLNELNGWSGNMREMASESGYSYATLLEVSSSYHIGIMTRERHEVRFCEEQSFAHGLLGVQYGTLCILVTHLTPISAVQRRHEAERIAEIVRSIQGAVVLAGDLNTLSPYDRVYLQQKHVLKTLRADTRLAEKFLDSNGMPDYTPMQLLLDAGLVDLGRGVENACTVPTPFNHDAAHALPLRLDYMLANKAFLQDGKVRVHPIRTTDTEQLSDHYPIVLHTGEGS